MGRCRAVGARGARGRGREPGGRVAGRGGARGSACGRGWRLVQRARSGQPRQAAPKSDLPGASDRAGDPVRAGHRVVVAVSSMVKSSRVNPPVIAGRSGQGLTTGVCPAASSRGQRVAGGVGRVGQHLDRLGVAGSGHLEQGDADGGVAVGGAGGPGQRAALVISPVSGSTTDVGLEAVLAALAGLVGVAGVGSTVEIIRSGATWRAIRHRPSVPSEPSAGSTSWPATSASNATASAARLEPVAAGWRASIPASTASRRPPAPRPARRARPGHPRRSRACPAGSSHARRAGRDLRDRSRCRRGPRGRPGGSRRSAG